MKEQDCTNYEPGYVVDRSIGELNNLLSRTKKEDNQRHTSFYYIYADDNFLMGR